MPAQFALNNNYSWLEGLDVIAATNYLIETGSINHDFLFQYAQSAAILDALNKSHRRDGYLRDRLKDQLASLVQRDPESLFSAYEAAYINWNKRTISYFKSFQIFPALADSVGRIRFLTLLRSVTPESKMFILDRIESDYFQKLLHEYNELPYPISGIKPTISSSTEEDAFETWDGQELAVFYQKRGLSIDLEGPVTQLAGFPASFIVAELAAERKKILESQVYPRLSLFIIRGISKLVLWAKVNTDKDEVLRSAIMNLQLAINFAKDWQAPIQADFNAIVDEAVNVGFKFALLNPYHFTVGTGSIQNPDGTETPYPVSSFVNAEIRRRMLLEVFAELPLQKAENISGNAVFFGNLLSANQDLLPKTKWQSLQAPSEWKFNAWEPHYKTRLDKITSEPQAYQNTEGATLPSLFSEGLSAYLRAVEQDIKSFNGYRFFMNARLAKDLQNLDGFCQLADRPRLISDVDQLIKTINTSPTGQYYQTMKADLESFKTQCLQAD
jgi:hypothetical protein